MCLAGVLRFLYPVYVPSCTPVCPVRTKEQSAPDHTAVQEEATHLDNRKRRTTQSDTQPKANPHSSAESSSVSHNKTFVYHLPHDTADDYSSLLHPYRESLRTFPGYKNFVWCITPETVQRFFICPVLQPLPERMSDSGGQLFRPTGSRQVYRKGRKVNCRKAARESGLGRTRTVNFCGRDRRTCSQMSCPLPENAD